MAHPQTNGWMAAEKASKRYDHFCSDRGLDTHETTRNVPNAHKLRMPGSTDTFVVEIEEILGAATLMLESAL